MKATLEFDLPEESPEHSYALAGVDALLVIEDILNEIRSKLKYDAGYFDEWIDEDDKKNKIKACDKTLERVRQFILEQKSQRNLPELI